MTATTQVRPRTVAPPRATAQAVLWGGLALNVLIVEILFFTSVEGKNEILTVAKFFGLHAALTMMLQIVLVSRIPWLDRRLGMDRLTAWHRWVGFTLYWTVLTHASLIILGYATLDGVPAWETFGALAGVTASLLGMIAASIVFTIGVTSVRYIRRKLPYEAWHAIHLLVYGAIVFGLIHQWLEPATFRTSTIATVYWATLWTLVLAGLVAGRLVMPLWRNFYHRFRVAEVVPEADNVVSVHVTGRHLDKLPARAGQFMIWRFPGYRNFWLANPFSLSAAPDGTRLRLTAKAVGKGSAGLRHVPVGTRVFAEGPYGAFTAMQRACDDTLLIAGGVGVTPIRALLEESTGSTIVLYRAQSTADAVLLPELETLARDRGAQLHVVTGRTGSGNPPVAPVEPENLLAMVPDITRRDVYVCGPPAMTGAVLRTLKLLKVPSRQVHAERFSLA